MYLCSQKVYSITYPRAKYIISYISISLLAPELHSNSHILNEMTIT